MHLFVIPLWLNISVSVSIVAFALWKGGWRERALASVHQVNGVVAYWCMAEHCQLMGYWTPLAARMRWDLTTDGAILLTCLIGAWRSDRWWVIWAAAFALARVATDVLSFHPQVTFWASASANLIWGVISYRLQRAHRASTI